MHIDLSQYQTDEELLASIFGHVETPADRAWSDAPLLTLNFKTGADRRSVEQAAESAARAVRSAIARESMPLPAVKETVSFANIQWPQFTFTPKPEPSPDAKPAIAGLMRVNGKARGFGWCDE